MKLSHEQRAQVFVRLRDEIDAYIGLKPSLQPRDEDRLVYVDPDRFKEVYDMHAESIASLNEPAEDDPSCTADHEADGPGCNCGARDAFMDSTLKHQVFDYDNAEGEFPEAARERRLADNDVSAAVAWYMLATLEEDAIESADEVNFIGFHTGTEQPEDEE